ncbi:MAG: hypothetical protein DRH34_09385 [Deltaproteobacteria bacterium]|nr:MAG: hypothetical protein DRH34_09385 [Deltaproteobacteria bacterium]
MKNIGIIIELDNGKIKETNFGMITLARADKSQLFAFVMDADTRDLKQELESFGITQLVNISLPPDQQNNPVIRAKAIINSFRPYHRIVLLIRWK